MDRLFAETLPTLVADVIPTMMTEAMPTVMAGVMPTLMAILPTAPPVPVGSPATLSQADLKGRWQGWITIDAVTLNNGSAEEQKACDEQLKLIKGRQIPTAMDFAPSSATTGMVTVITDEEPQAGSQDDAIPYAYRSGTITIQDIDSGGTVSNFEGKTIQTADGYAISGKWKSEGEMDPGSSDDAVVVGTWVVRKAR